MSNVTFLSVEEFKSLVGETKFDIVRSPKTNKLFVAGEKANYKCELELDLTKPIKFIVNDGDMNTACLANVKPGGEILSTI